MFSRTDVAQRLELFTGELRKPCSTDRLENIANLLRSWAETLDKLAAYERTHGYIGEEKHSGGPGAT